MFTGIVTDIGRILAADDRNDGRSLRIGCAYDTSGIDIGASIACDGICLTVTATDRTAAQATAEGSASDAGWFEVFAARETLEVTDVGQWNVGRRLNLERSLRIGDELGGHMVLGHVDGLARIVGRRTFGDQIAFELEAPEGVARFIATKGSVALNGTSLTVNAVEGNRFTVHLIPHTIAVTNWADVGEGDMVNVEVDPMARYAARLLETTAAGSTAGRGE